MTESDKLKWVEVKGYSSSAQQAVFFKDGLIPAPDKPYRVISPHYAAAFNTLEEAQRNASFMENRQPILSQPRYVRPILTFILRHFPEYGHLIDQKSGSYKIIHQPDRPKNSGLPNFHPNGKITKDESS